MGCYRCGIRQLEPGRGSEPWQQGVLGDRQVLICPGCQSAGDWAADLDHCAVCTSIALVRRLGEVECRSCGASGEVARPHGSSGSAALPDLVPAGLPDAVPAGLADAVPAGLPDAVPAGLAEEVEQALARVLRLRSAGQPEPGGTGAAG